MIDTITGELLLDQPVITNKDIVINTSVIFIEKIVKIRRCLCLNRKIYTTKHNSIGPQYYKRIKDGVKIPYKNISSHRNICRVKLTDDKSNHPKQWLYIDNGHAERFKYNKAPYGGTTYDKTFFMNGEWRNRNVYRV